MQFRDGPVEGDAEKLNWGSWLGSEEATLPNAHRQGYRIRSAITHWTLAKSDPCAVSSCSCGPSVDQAHASAASPLQCQGRDWSLTFLTRKSLIR